jgi:HEAT repeat protein
MALLAFHGGFPTGIYGQAEQPSQQIKDLIHKLQDGDVDERQRAAIALGTEKNPSAVEPLIKALSDEDEFVRDFAVKALGNIGDPRALAPLIAALSDENVLVRRSAATALGNLGDPKALEPLLDALKSGQYMVRRAAARALGTLGDPGAIDALIGALGDDDPYIRNSAVVALARIGQPALPKLIDALGNWTIGPYAAEALGNQGWKPSSDQERIRFDVARRNKQALLDNWQTARKVLMEDANGENSILAQNAVFALIGIGRDEIIEELVRILDEKGNAVMAKAYQNCGNGSLLEAARAWAAKHGEEQIGQQDEGVLVEWGGMNSSQIAENITGIP